MVNAQGNREHDLQSVVERLSGPHRVGLHLRQLISCGDNMMIVCVHVCIILPASKPSL